MSPILVKLSSAVIMHSSAIIITKKITNSKVKLLTLKNFLWLLFSLVPGVLFYVSEYDFTTLLTFFFLIISAKKIFGFDIMVATIAILFVMIVSIFPDSILSSIAIHYIGFKEVRRNLPIMLTTSLLISSATYILFCFPFLKKFTQNCLEKIQKPKHRKILLFVILAFMSICIIYFTLAQLFVPTQNYFTSNIVVLIFVILIFIYMNEIIKYDKLEMQNETLYECMQNVEEYQEQQDLKIHEYKNQLSKIVAVTKEKKVLKMLEDILQIDLTTDTYILGQLKYIPKGEIKSLIYYKLLVASKHGLNILVDISPKLKKEDFIFATKKNTELSQLLGIYFDNAIEASLVSEKKELSFEVYLVKGNLTFIIMNTYKDKISIKDMQKKGFTTKGAEHGKGLYFANKIIKRNSCFISNSEFIKNYYMQKITIKKD